MNTKTALDAISADIRTRETYIDTLQQVACKEISALQRTQGNLLRQYIQEARLLDFCLWHLIVSSQKISLSCNEWTNVQKAEELKALCETDYHCQFNLVVEPYAHDPNYDKGLVTLHFDDGEIRILFDESKYISDFVKTFGVKIDTSRIDKKMEDLQSAIDALAAIKTLVEE